jgi:putative copper export protein
LDQYALAKVPLYSRKFKGDPVTWILYIHILSACAWIGGSIVLFGLGVFIRDRATQEAVYGTIGPFYGYFETVWLLILISTGFVLGNHYQLFSVMSSDTELGHYVIWKLVLVSLLSIATMVHLYIAFATHKTTRTLVQKFLSRGGSLAIFLLNLAILWVAINIRSTL